MLVCIADNALMELTLLGYNIVEPQFAVHSSSASPTVLELPFRPQIDLLILERFSWIFVIHLASYLFSFQAQRLR